MKGKYQKPSELLRLQKETGRSYWDLIGRPLYDEGKDTEKITNEDKDDLIKAIDYALSLSFDKPTYDKGKDNYVHQDAGLSYGGYYDIPTGDILMDVLVPKYEEGKDPNKNVVPSFSDAEAAEYIGQIENADSIGYDRKRRIWTTPKSAAYDRNSIGMGLDIRAEHNPRVYNYLKQRGRLNSPWLTEREERTLREQTWQEKKKNYMNNFILAYGPYINQMGYNRAAGMLWQGHPFKKMNDKESVTGKALQNSIKTGDKSLQRTFDTYYGFGTNATRYADRMRRDKLYILKKTKRRK